MDGEVLGWTDGESKAASLLGRIIRCIEHGAEVEADPKQLEGLVEEYGLDGPSGVDTPGV